MNGAERAQGGGAVNLCFEMISSLSFADAMIAYTSNDEASLNQ